MKTPNADRLKYGIYADILSNILSGQFQPGYRLIEGDLARAHRVSRTPIREILFSLREVGLVERTPHRGARVVSFGADDIEQIYEVRIALECLAVRKAAQRLDLNQLFEIERRLLIANQCSSPDWKRDQAEIDLLLHRTIVSGSGNRRLESYLENVSLLIHSLRLIGYRSEKFARETGEEHMAIVRALLRRDTQLAEYLLANHINSSMRHVLDLAFRGTDKVKSVPGNHLMRTATLRGVKATNS